MIRKFVVIILGLLGIADLSAMIKVSGVFADNMVIQRLSLIHIFGQAFWPCGQILQRRNNRKESFGNI